MLNCEGNPGVGQVLESVLSLLDEARIEERIDGPIDTSSEEFIAALRLSEGLTEGGFQELSADFVAHVYACGLPLSLGMTAREARSQALYLIDGCYRGIHADGYDGALLDALRLGYDGVTSVLMSLASHLKAEERERHFRWVMATHIKPLSWQEKCRLVEAMLRRWETWLPEEVRELPVEQLAYLYADLIKGHLSTVDALERVCVAIPMSRVGGHARLSH